MLQPAAAVECKLQNFAREWIECTSTLYETINMIKVEGWNKLWMIYDYEVQHSTTNKQTCCWIDVNCQW